MYEKYIHAIFEIWNLKPKGKKRKRKRKKGRLSYHRDVCFVLILHAVDTVYGIRKRTVK